MNAHPLSAMIARCSANYIVESTRLSQGDWVVRVFDPANRFTAMLSVMHASRIEREVYRLGAHRVAARIRFARCSAMKRACR